MRMCVCADALTSAPSINRRERESQLCVKLQSGKRRLTVLCACFFPIRGMTGRSRNWKLSLVARYKCPISCNEWNGARCRLNIGYFFPTCHIRPNATYYIGHACSLSTRHFRGNFNAREERRSAKTFWQIENCTCALGFSSELSGHAHMRARFVSSADESLEFPSRSLCR